MPLIEPMLQTLLSLALLSGARGPAPPSSDPSTEPAAAPRITVVALDVEPELQGPLRDGLLLRLDAVEVVPFGEDPGAASPGQRAYVRVRGPVRAVYEVSVIVSDGRAYAREIAAPEAMAARILGGELALLIRGIEEGTEVPDREDAVMPDLGGEATTDPAASDGTDAPTDTGEVSTTDPTTSTPTAGDGAEPEPEPEPFALGIRVGTGAAIGMVPGGDVGRSLAGTGELGLGLRWPRGSLVVVAVRTGGRRAGNHSLLRTRISAGGGYLVQRGAFELPLTASLAVEPWGVRTGGRSILVRPVDGDARATTLLGAYARAGPGLRLALASRPTVHLRVGGFFELGGSASPGGGAPRLRDVSTSEVVARLGGLEVALGLEIELWIALRRETGAPPSATSPRPDG